MMGGEIRDLETAEVAVQAALTGHLVFSTLHTNDAAGGVAPLIHMGIPPYLITSAATAFIAQRLVCPLCTEGPDGGACPTTTRILLRGGPVSAPPGERCRAWRFTRLPRPTAIF